MGAAYRNAIAAMFAKADIRIDGDRPFDIKVTDERFFTAVIQRGMLGLGEAYMDGWWTCDSIPNLTAKVIRVNLHKDTFKNPRLILYALGVRLSGIGRKGKAFEVGQHHYDLGNNLFEAMLDPRMIYSCAYWKDAATLEQAQHNKLDLICRKLGLKPGMRVLEIGCGWGGWAKFAAENYGVEVVGLTVSKEQRQYAHQSCSKLPVEIRLQDYREIDEKFDRVASIAMFEAVGRNYYRTFMKVVDRCLKSDGLFLLHTIVGNQPVAAEEAPWLNKYIFPNGELPSVAQIGKAAEGLFVLEGAHHLAGDYEKTLAAWYDNFVANWHRIEKSYDSRFYRMWEFYLLLCRGIFQSQLIHVWQFVFSKNGIPGIAQTDLPAHFEFCDVR